MQAQPGSQPASPLVRGRGSKLSHAHYIGSLPSPLVRGRSKRLSTGLVAPRAGAWIETGGPPVDPHRERLVAPRAGAWIETAELAQ